MSIEKIKKTTIVEQVMEQIKALIASGAFKSGDKIPTELELAESFGVGRSTIREAIKIFNYMGVLKSQAAKGTYVEDRSNISSESLTWSLLLGEDELNEMIDLRGSIEMWSIIRLTENLTTGDPKALRVENKLEKLITEMQSASEEGNRSKLIELDFQFHLAIIEGCSNSLFLSLFDTLKSFLYDEIKQSQLDYKDLSMIPDEHMSMLSAVRSGNSSEVLKTYNAHINNIKARIGKNSAAVE